MWICNRCQTGNRDGDHRCIQCGAPQSRRFGAGTVINTPSGAPRAQEAVPQAAAPLPRAETPPPGRPQHPPKTPASARALRLVGLLLAILLPLMVAGLAWRLYGTLLPQLDLLLFPQPASGFVVAPLTRTAPLISVAAYILVFLAALLLSLLPGLMAMGLGSLIIRLSFRERRAP
ncbi:MAG: hypothetical protein AB9880_08040 [Christensenellales bacterium]